MKSTISHILLLILFLLLGATNLHAQQTYPIYVNPMLTPPYSLVLSDYAQPGSQRLVVTVMVKDVTVTNLPVRLHLKMENMNGATIESIPTAAVTPIFLGGGETLVLFGDDMREYFDIRNLQFKGYSKDEYRRTGQLPEGFWRFTVEVRHLTTGRLISNRGTTTAWMALGKPPILKIPDNNAELGQIMGMPLTFSWIPQNVGVHGVTPQYTFEMWEMRVPGINPNVVAASMPVFYSTTQMHTNLVVHPAELMLEPGMNYAWRVTASDMMGQVPFAQGGRSEVRSFIYQCRCDSITDFRVERQGQDVTYRWNPSKDNTSYNIEVENPVSGWSKTDKVYDNKYPFKSDPDKTYRVRVQAICQSNEMNPSEFSTWKSVTIPAIKTLQEICPDCECGKEVPDKPLTNFTLRTDLQPGDTIINRRGTSRFIITSVVPQGNGVYKGQLLSWIRIWGIKVPCEYWGLKVNTDNQIVYMEGMKDIKDPKFFVDVDATKEYLNQLGDAVNVIWDEISKLIDDLYENIKLNNEINYFVDNFVNDYTEGIKNVDFSQLPEFKDLSPEEIEQLKQELIELINGDEFKRDLAEKLKEAKKEIETEGLSKDKFGESLKSYFNVATSMDAYMELSIINPRGKNEKIHRDAVLIQDSNDQTIAFVLPDETIFYWVYTDKAYGYFKSTDNPSYKNSYMGYYEDKYNRKTQPISWGIYLAAYDLGQFAIDFGTSPLETTSNFAKGIWKIATFQFDIEKTWNRIINADLTDASYVVSTVLICQLAGPKGKRLIPENDVPRFGEFLGEATSTVATGGSKMTWPQVLALFQKARAFESSITQHLMKLYPVEQGYKVFRQVYLKVDGVTSIVDDLIYNTKTNKFILNETKYGASNTLRKNQKVLQDAIKQGKEIEIKSVRGLDGTPYKYTDKITTIEEIIRSYSIDGTITNNTVQTIWKKK